MGQLADHYIHLQTDDNASESGLCYDQPPAPTADLLCVLKHLDVLRRVCAQLNDLLDDYDEVTPQPDRSTFARERARIAAWALAG